MKNTALINILTDMLDGQWEDGEGNKVDIEQVHYILNLEKTTIRYAKWVINKCVNLTRDHACSECVPNGPIVVDGFLCTYHHAIKFLEDIERGKNE